MRVSPAVIAVAAALVAVVLVAPSVSDADALSPIRQGAELWVDRYDPDDLDATGLEPLVAPDGSVLYAVGVASRADSSSYRVVAFDPATGEELWVAQRPAALALRHSRPTAPGSTFPARRRQTM